MFNSSSCENALDLYGMHASTSYSQIELKSSSRRSSESQRSQLSLSVLPENKPPKSNMTSFSSMAMDTRSEDFSVMLPVSKTMSDRSVSMERESASKSAPHSISFFLGNSDKSVTSNSVNDEYLGAVGGAEFDGMFETQDTEACKQQKSYASVPDIQRRNSADFETEHGCQNDSSIFCPFLSTDSHQHKNTLFGNLDNQNKIQKSGTQDNNRAGTYDSKCALPSIEKRKTLPLIKIESDNIIASNHASSPTPSTVTDRLPQCPFRTVPMDYEQKLSPLEPCSENDDSFHQGIHTNNTIEQLHIGLTDGDSEKDCDHDLQGQPNEVSEMDIMTEKLCSFGLNINERQGLVQADKNCDGENIHAKSDKLQRKSANSFPSDIVHAKSDRLQRKSANRFPSDIHIKKHQFEKTIKIKDPAIFLRNCDKKVQSQMNCVNSLNGSLPHSDCEQNSSTSIYNAISLDMESGPIPCNGHGINLTNLSKQISKNV